MTNKTLIILTPGFPANEADCTCMPFPQLFVKKLKELYPSLNISVLAFQYPFVKGSYVWNDVQVEAFNGQNKGKIKRLMVWHAVWQRVADIVRKQRVIGFLNFWMGECGWMGNQFSRKYGIPSYTWLLGQDARIHNRYVRMAKPKPQQLLALSDAIAAQFQKNYQITPANTIQPGIDTQNFPPVAVVRDIDILGAGSLIPLKRYNIFINMVAALLPSFPGLNTMICGKGPEHAKLQAMIDNAGLNKNIQLLGECTHHEALSLMRRSKIFLHPSSYEGFATVMQESLYAGAELVAFCQPMKTLYEKQHIVTSEEELLQVLHKLLYRNQFSPKSVMVNHIEDTCRSVMELFNQ